MAKGMSSLRLFMRNGPRRTVPDGAGGTTSSESDGSVSSNQQARQPLGAITEIVRNPLTPAADQSIGAAQPPSPRGGKPDTNPSNGRGKGKATGSNAQERFPHLENTEGIANLSNVASDFSHNGATSTGKNNGKFTWHQRQGSHGKDSSLDLTTPPRPSRQAANVDASQSAAASGGNGAGGQQASAGLSRAGSNGGGSVPSTPKSARGAGASTDSEVGASRSQYGTPSKAVSRALKYGQPTNSTNSGTSGGTSARPAVSQHTISKPVAGYMQPVKSLLPLPPQHQFPVQHFELEEDPKFWRDHNVQVLIRTRPVSSSELAVQGCSRCLKQESPHTVSWLGQPESRFTFDHVASETISQAKLFEVAGLPMVDNCMSGYNSCMFAYGQTGSGKTHTMLGDIEALDRSPSENRGMTPRVFEYLFGRIRMEQEGRRQEHLKFFCKCSFLEIYNEQITDLLEPSSTNLQMREDAKKGVYVENLSEVEVESVRDVIQLLLQGAANRKVAATNMNRESSRSHSVFTCVVESKWESNSMTNSRYGRLHLVDLAGSERQKSSGAEGGRLKEAANINKSLSTLGLVIMILVDVANGRQRHVPYRDSKLTFLLQDSLGGNSKTIMIANVSPSSCCTMETLSTLKFAQRAKFIRNNAVINEDAAGDVIALRRQVDELKVELDRLRRESLSRTPSLRHLPLQSGSIGKLDSEDLMEIDSVAIGRSSPDSVNNSGRSKHIVTNNNDKKTKSLEAVLAGALRREQISDDNTKKLAAEIEQLNRLVRQREEDSQCSKMMLRFREEKIRRLEGIADNEMPVDSFQEKENANLQEELQVLRGRLDRNPELTRFAMENIRLMEQLRSYQEFFDCGQKDVLLEEVSGLRNQLLDTLDTKLGGEQTLTTPQKKALAPEFAALTRENELLLVEVESYRKELKECRDNLNSLLEANAEMARQMDDLEATAKHLKSEHSQSDPQKDDQAQIDFSIRMQLEEQLQNALHELDVLRRNVPGEEQVQAEAKLQNQLQEQLAAALAELDELRGKTEVNASMRMELQEQLTSALHELDNLRGQMQVSDEAKEQLASAEDVARRLHLTEASLVAAQETASSAQLTVKQIRQETEELASQQKQSRTDIEKAALMWREQELDLRNRLRDAEEVIQKLQNQEQTQAPSDGADVDRTNALQEELDESREIEARHSEEMSQMQLELDSIQEIVNAEKEQRLEAEQKSEDLVSQLNAALSKVKEAELLGEALEEQQLFSLKELENLQAEHAEALKALKEYEDQKDASREHFHSEGVETDPAYRILEHKLQRARKAKEEARKMNVQFQEEKASQLARDKEREVIMSEVETQAALAITTLQSEILELKEETSAAAEIEANSNLQVLQLRKELEALEIIVCELREQNTHLSEEHAEYERLNAAASEARVERDAAQDSLVRESEKKAVAAFLLVRKLISDAEQLKAAVQLQANDIFEKSGELTVLRAAIDSLQQRTKLDRDGLTDLTTRYQSLTEANATQQLENDRLMRELEINDDNATLRVKESETKAMSAMVVAKQLAKNKEELLAANLDSHREMQEAKFAIAEAETKMAAMRQQLDESGLTLNLLAEEHRVLEDAHQRLREDFEQSEMQCAKLQEEQDTAQAQRDRQLEEYATTKISEESSVKQSERKAKVAFVALEHLSGRIAELKGENGRLEIVVVSTQQEREQATANLTALQQEFEQERHLFGEMSSRFDLLEDSYQRLHEEYDSRVEEQNTLAGNNEDMERRIKLSERKCMAALVLLEHTGKKMQSLKAADVSLQRDLQEATDGGASLLLQLEEEIQERKSIAERHEILISEHETLRDEYAHMEKAVEDANAENAQKAGTLNDLQQLLDHEIQHHATVADRHVSLTEQHESLRGEHERLLADHEHHLGEYAVCVESKDRSVKESERKAMAAFVILEHLTDSRQDLRAEIARLATEMQDAEVLKESQLLALRQELERNGHHYSEIEERQRSLMDANEKLREEHVHSQSEYVRLLEEKCAVVENGESMLRLSEKKASAAFVLSGQLEDCRMSLLEENERLREAIHEARAQNESQLLALQDELEKNSQQYSEIEERQHLLIEAHERLREEHRRSQENHENMLRENAMVLGDGQHTIRQLERKAAAAFLVVANLRGKWGDSKAEIVSVRADMHDAATEAELQRSLLREELERHSSQYAEFENRHVLLMNEHERLRAAYEKSRDQHDRLQEAQEMSQAEQVKFRDEFENLQSSYVSLRAEYETSQREQERLLALSVSASEDNQRSVSVAEKKALAAAVAVAQIAGKKESLDGEHTRLESEFQATSSALAVLDASHRELIDVHETLKGDHGKEKAKFANLCGKYEFLKKEALVAFIILRHFSDQQCELVVRTEELAEDVEGVQVSNAQKDAEISALHKQLELECENSAKAGGEQRLLQDANRTLHEELQILRAEGLSIVDIRERLVRRAEAKASAALVTLGHLKKTNEDWQAVNEKLEGEVSESLAEVKTRDSAINALELQLKEHEQLTDAYQGLLEEHGQLEAALERTVAEMSSSIREREQLVNATEKKASAAFVLLEHLRNGSEGLLTENENLEEELRESRDLCAKKDLAVSSLKQGLDEYRRRVHATLEMTEDLEAKALNVVTEALSSYGRTYVDEGEVSTSLEGPESSLSGVFEMGAAAIRLGEIENELEYLLSLVTQLEEDNAAGRSEVGMLQSQVESLAATVDIRERELQNEREARYQLVLASEAEAAKSKSLVEERAALTTERKDSRSESLQKEKAVQNLRVEVQTLESNLQLAELKIAEMLTAAQALTVAKAELELDRERLAVSVQNAEANCSEKERALIALQSDFAELQSRVDEAEIRENSVLERMEELEVGKVQLEAEKAHLESEIRRMKVEKAHLGSNVQNLNEEILRRESTLLDSFGKSQLALDEIDSRMEAMVAEFAELELSKHNLENVLEMLESAACTHSEALEEKEQETVDLKIRLESAELRIAEMITVLDASAAGVRAEQERSVATERKMRDDRESMETQLRDELGELQSAKAILEEELASATLSTSEWAVALEDKEDELVELQGRLEMAESQISDLQSALGSTTKQFQSEKEAWDEDKHSQERRGHEREIEIREQIAAAEAKLLTTEGYLKSAAEAVEAFSLTKVELEDEIEMLHQDAKISQFKIESQKDVITDLKATAEQLKVEEEEAQRKLNALTEMRDQYILSEMNWRSEREELTQRLESVESASGSRDAVTSGGVLLAQCLPPEQSEQIQIHLEKLKCDNDALRAMASEKDRTIVSARKEMEMAIANLKEAEVESEKVRQEKQRLAKHCLENNDLIGSISHKLRHAEEELWKRETRIEGCEAELQKVSVILSEWDVKMHVVEEEWRKEREALAQELTEAKLDASEARSEAAALLHKFQDGQATLKEANGLVDALVRANENAKIHAFDWQCEKDNLGIVQGWWMPERDRLVSTIGGLETDLHTQKQDMRMVCREAMVGLAEAMNVLTLANQEVTCLDKFMHEEMALLLNEVDIIKADVAAGLKIPAYFRTELESLCARHEHLVREAKGNPSWTEKAAEAEITSTEILQLTSERDAARKQNAELKADIATLDGQMHNLQVRLAAVKSFRLDSAAVNSREEDLSADGECFGETFSNVELQRAYVKADMMCSQLERTIKEVDNLNDRLVKDEAGRLEFVQISNDKIVRLTDEANEHRANLAQSREASALLESEIDKMKIILALSDDNTHEKGDSVNAMILELEESRFNLARAGENLADLKLELREAEGTVRQLRSEQELNSATISELDEKLLAARQESAFLAEKHDVHIRQWEEERGLSEDQLMEQLLKQNALSGQLQHIVSEKEAAILANSKLQTLVKNIEQSHAACVQDLHLSQRTLKSEVSVLKQLQVELKGLSEGLSEDKNGAHSFVVGIDELHADIEDMNNIAEGLAVLSKEVRDIEGLSNALDRNIVGKHDATTGQLLQFENGRAFAAAISACSTLVSDMPKSIVGLEDFQLLRSICAVHHEIRGEFGAMKEDIDAFQQAMKELHLRNSDLEDELDEKTQALEDMSEEFVMAEQTLTHAMDALTMEIKSIESERDKFQTDNVVLSEQLEMAQTLADERGSVAAEARQVAALSKSQAEEKEEEARILGRSVEELERTVYALETQLIIVRQEAERQRETRETLEKELDVVREQMRFMQSKVDEQEVQTLKDSQVAETSKTELDRVVIEMKSQQIHARKSVESLQQECAEKDVQLRSCKAHVAELMLGAEKQATENQQKLKNLESMLEQLKADDRKGSSVCPGSGKFTEKSTSAKVKGAASPFKCIGSGLAQQRSAEIDEELTSATKRIKELEVVVAAKQKEIFMLNTKLAEAESMTHDVVRDLLGVKMDIASYATLLNQQQMQRIAERARKRTIEAQEKEEEMTTLRKRLSEFIDERESWLEEINRRQAEAVAARVSAEKFRLKDQTLVEENERFEEECLALRRRVTDLEAEVKKLSGQQNLQQRIHHHAKIKEQNNSFRAEVEDLSGKLRRMEILFTRVNDELARYRNADGKSAYISFDEEARLERELQETEENRLQLAETLTGLCTGIMKAAGVQRLTRELDPAAAMHALQQLQDRVEFLERELSDYKLKMRIAGEKRRISDLRELHTPVRNLSTNFAAAQQLPSPVSSAR